jgi:uncharacterized protein (DUF362 family)
MRLSIIDFSTFHESVPAVLDLIGAEKTLAEQSSILIKPNLVNDSPHPITTSPDFCEAVVRYAQSCTRAEIIIAEGCGDASMETDEIFRRLGYENLSKKYNIQLIDLNHSPLKRLENSDCPFFPEMFLPEIALTSFIISLPVLKAHSLSAITGTMKNMMGFAPPQYYSGKFGVWKKAVFHENIHQAIIDLNRYRSPDLSLIDGSVGLSEYHLGGPCCNPPVNKILAGYDPLEVDRKAAAFLNLDWKQIPHLAKETNG